VNAVGKTELEKGEEGSEGGGRHIKVADFDEEERRRKFHGSRGSRLCHPEIACTRTEGAWLQRNES
jgi:hypothetical protein